MVLSRVVSEIFIVEKYRDLEIPVKSQSRSLTVCVTDYERSHGTALPLIAPKLYACQYSGFYETI